jgi:hypothetical protein
VVEDQIVVVMIDSRSDIAGTLIPLSDSLAARSNFSLAAAGGFMLAVAGPGRRGIG